MGFLKSSLPLVAQAAEFRASTQGISRRGPVSQRRLGRFNQQGEPDMAKKAAAPATITLKHLAAALAEEHDLSKKAAEAILTDMVGKIAKHLKKGERIRIVGLGILQVRKRAARTGRNPATGEPIQIKASKKVAFRAAKELKEAV